jgi:hypothetical protein
LPKKGKEAFTSKEKTWLQMWHMRKKKSRSVISSRQKLTWFTDARTRRLYPWMKDRLGDQRGGEWMGADKNSSRGRLKLRQDELARSNPRNHTLRTSTPRLPKPRSHWSATGPRNKLYQQPQHTRSTDSGNNSKAG